MKRFFSIFLLYFTFSILYSSFSFGQLKWQNVDSLFQPLPSSVHIYFTNNPIDTAPFRAFYLIADLKDKKLEFTVDTAHDRRLTPSIFYQKNNKPLLVVNCTFFSYETNRSLNVIIKDRRLVAYNPQSVKGKGKDSLLYFYPFRSAIGINDNGKADVAWLYTDSSKKYPIAFQIPLCESKNGKEISLKLTPKKAMNIRGCMYDIITRNIIIRKWKFKSAIGGGPVLLQGGLQHITNEEEMMFTGKAINDKHPRTAMGYTKDNKLIILLIEGRNKVAHGATLGQEARIFQDLGCWEALNLDGGGSSCMLVNGKETIKVSDTTGQRPVPAVFIIRSRGAKK